MTEVVHLGLALALGSLDGLVGAGLVRQSLVGVLQLLLDHPPVPVRLLQQGAGLLQRILVGVAAPVRSDEVVLGDGLGPGLLLKPGLDLAQSLLDHLDLTLALSIGSVSVLQTGVEVKHISLELLLHPQSFSLALRLSLQSHLHPLESLAIVLLGGGKFLPLSQNSLLDLLPDLGELQLAPQHLVLLLLQSALSLGQGSLELHLLSLEPLPDFVNLVDGAASLANLVHDVLDLI